MMLHTKCSPAKYEGREKIIAMLIDSSKLAACQFHILENTKTCSEGKRYSAELLTFSALILTSKMGYVTQTDLILFFTRSRNDLW